MKRRTGITRSTLAVTLLLALSGLSLPSASAAAEDPPPLAGVKTWGGAGAIAMAKSARVDSAGNLYVAGEFRGTVDFDPAGPNPSATFTSQNGTTDAFVSKFDAGGNFQWARTWGTGTTGGLSVAMGAGRDAANSLALDGAGNLYVAGLYQSAVDFGAGFSAISNAPAGFNNIFLVKLAPDGTTQWLRAWGGKAGGEGYSVAVDAARGAVYVEGDWSTSPNTGAVDFNPAGPTHDEHANHGMYDAFLSKYDLDGNFQWAKTWGGAGYDDGPGVTVSPDGSLFVSGMYGSQDINFDPDGGSAGLGHPATDTGNPLTFVDVFLSKFDAAGRFQWVRTWGGLDQGGQGTVNAGELAAADRSGSVYIVGRFGCDACDFNAGPSGSPDLHSSSGKLDAFVSKYDADGNFLWARTWGGSENDGAGGVAVDALNNVFVAGLFSGDADLGSGPVTSQGLADVSLTQFSADGALGWALAWGGGGNDVNFGLALGRAGDGYAFGSFQNTVDFDPGSGESRRSATGTQDAFLSKFSGMAAVLDRAIYLPLVSR